MNCRAKFFFGQLVPDSAIRLGVHGFSYPASLVSQRRARTIHDVPTHQETRSLLQPLITAVHRFEELIGGHPYLIEVSAVAKDRWRANIVRIPGVPTALMPFYGPTPDEAAGQLRQWLVRAHERVSSGTSGPRPGASRS
ncbi:MAG: hypothetical protein A3H97_16215 [Acidobacteria bacterium RIFCSPLOWO2_02_FULL_65_29]|nr:MAG: hypothetical protein A3H97_16215 [Acidobacteria bacterium RIFCSPLOWO2_02_FULL_65_29]